MSSSNTATDKIQVSIKTNEINNKEQNHANTYYYYYTIRKTHTPTHNLIVVNKITAGVTKSLK